MKIRDKYTCPLELVFDMLAGKWKCIIIWRLRLGKQSLSTLNNDIRGINQKMLIQHLNELIECKMVDKKVYEGYPLKVEYFLTSLGREILHALEIFQNIGIKHYQEYLDAEGNNGGLENGTR